MSNLCLKRIFLIKNSLRNIDYCCIYALSIVLNYAQLNFIKFTRVWEWFYNACIVEKEMKSADDISTRKDKT